MRRSKAGRAVAALAVLALLGIGAALLIPGPGGDQVAAKKPPPKGSVCDQVVGGVDAAKQAVSAAAPGAVICLRDGEYGEVGLNAEKTGPGVTLRAENPGKAKIKGADLTGSRLTLAEFKVDGQVTIEPGSRKMTVEHNRITSGYFGVEAGPTENVNISDTTIRGNQFIGPFGEDAIRLNRYHDSGDRDPYGVLIEENEITGVREDGNHSDCLQSVWGGDDLYFRRNYIHDNRCQGFFINDQPEPVKNVVIEDNLMLRNIAPCAPSAPGCGPPLIIQIFGPTQGVKFLHNTVWTNTDDSPVALREGPFGKVTFRQNVFYRGWTDWTGGFPNYEEKENVVCIWEGLPKLSPSTQHICHPHFKDAKADDYRLKDGRGVDWSPAEMHFGP